MGTKSLPNFRSCFQRLVVQGAINYMFLLKLFLRGKKEEQEQEGDKGRGIS